MAYDMAYDTWSLVCLDEERGRYIASSRSLELILLDKILSEENFCRVVVLSEEGDTVSERCKMSLLTK